MPRGDGTGPRGLGPMTGIAALGFGYGRGFGKGLGRGYGRGFRSGYAYPIPCVPQVYGGEFYQPPAEPKQEMEMLAEEAKYLKEQLETINKRITELEKSEKK